VIKKNKIWERLYWDSGGNPWPGPAHHSYAAGERRWGWPYTFQNSL